MILKEVSTQDLKKFGLVMTIAIPVIFGLVVPFLFNNQYPIEPWIIGTMIFIVYLFYPKLLKFLYIPWMIIAEKLGRFNTALILIIVFYVMITPISLLFKLTGRDVLSRKIIKKTSTYRIAVNSESKYTSSMKNPF